MLDKGVCKKRMDEMRCCVIIPTYNNDKTLADVIDGALLHSDNVIVVNDGSTDSTGDILKRYPQITVLSLKKNSGKGAALRRGFSHAHQSGFKYAIALDSDGQHLTNDIPLFVEKLDEEPKAIIIGARNMDQGGIPKKSSFGNKFSNFWFNLETGISLPDTQSGFRLYPLELIHDIKFTKERFDFEIEVMVLSAWRGVRVVAIPISIYYAPKETRVSHFRPFVDFHRISILNTYLVTIALFYIIPRNFFRGLSRESIKAFIKKNVLERDVTNKGVALSVTLGVFCGIIPAWGFQLAIAVFLAHIFKLDKLITIISANISVPPMIPIILYTSYMTGGVLLNSAETIKYSSDFSFEIIRENLTQYIVGAFSFGMIAALSLGVTSYILLRLFRRGSQ